MLTEPVLFLKLRIHFTDFPYLQCLSNRCCSPWRPATVMSTTRRKNHRFPRIFKGHRERIRHHEKCGTLPDIKPYLRAILFPGSFALPHLPKSSNIRFGIITQFPFCRHVQLLSTWNLSPLRSSKFSFKYLLLLRHDSRVFLIVEVGRSPRWQRIGVMLELCQFSRLVASASELLHIP